MISSDCYVKHEGRAFIVLFLRNAACLIPLFLALGACADKESISHQPENPQPNILLIVADDLGYSDISPFGAEISTPNLQALADDGIKFTRFYASPTCSPTRAMLLTGIDSHQVGLGTMAERRTGKHENVAGYEGYLNHDVATLPEVLLGSGYHTYMAGKWHLGMGPDLNPAARGFEKSFALLDGAASHLNGDGYRDPARYGSPNYAVDGEPTSPPENFYSTRFYTERLISYIDEQKSDGKPFFGYLALTTPHWPLQAPESSRNSYAGFYDEGYDVWYTRRLEAMKDAGVLPQAARPFQRFSGERPWQDLTKEEKRLSARKMEIQAAMIEDMDRYIGRLFDYLKSIDRFDNTVILFMSDNGVDARHIDQRIRSIGDWPSRCCDNSLENMGAADSFVWIGPSWGRLSSGPFRLWKGSTSEGGTRVPAIMRLPKSGVGVFGSIVTVKDVMPTLLDLADVSAPVSEFNGRPVLPLQGQSIVAALADPDTTDRTDYYGLELSGKRSLIQGDWKLLWDSEPFGNNRWTLYNLRTDSGETDDVSLLHPEKMGEMLQLWQDYVRSNNVLDTL